MEIKRTKIIATLGPATSSTEMIEKLVKAGANIFRINTSHGDPAMIQELTGRIREVEKKLNTFVGILLDLQGPKIRTGIFENGSIEIHQGDELVFTTENVTGTDKVVPIQYKKFHLDVAVGHKVLLNDGNLSVIVKRIEGKRVIVEVEKGGTLSNHKGLNLPESSISEPPVTKKDKEALYCGLKCGVDFVALSFVRNGQDIKALRKLIKNAGADVQIIAKVERHEAIKNIDDIINEADGVMVARGDMGVEIPFEEVPIVKKNILAKCSKVGKPVIVATQMLESMIQNYRPTRAEISDVATAVSYYADALMLSAETAVGAYPVQAVEAMSRTATAMENYQYNNHKIMPWMSPENTTTSITHGITYAANQLAELLKASAIIVFTETGETAIRVAKHRPCIPIFAFTSGVAVARQMTMTRALNPFLMANAIDIKHPLKFFFNFLKKRKMVKKGDRVILTSGIPMQGAGNTNMIRAETVR
ncbi:MAG: pyruvate kinase [Candidatus Anammoxibacter sp.]